VYCVQLETEEREELRRSAENPQKAGNALPPDSPLARRSLSQVGDFAIRRQTSRHLDPAASFPSLTRVFEGVRILPLLAVSKLV